MGHNPFIPITNQDTNLNTCRGRQEIKTALPSEFVLLDNPLNKFIERLVKDKPLSYPNAREKQDMRIRRIRKEEKLKSDKLFYSKKCKRL